MEFHSKVVRKNRVPLQIILVSYDHSQGDMYRWMHSPLTTKGGRPMPWLAAPFGSSLQFELQERYNSLLRGLPTLILLNSEGTVVTNRAHAEIALHGADAWERLYEKLAELSDQEEGCDVGVGRDAVAFDIFADATTVMGQLFTELKQGEPDDDREVVNGEGPTCSVRDQTRQRLALVHIGADWSDGSSWLEKMLSKPEVENVIGSSFVTGRLCYETSQRWLMENAPPLHHCPLPTLAVFNSSAQLIDHADFDTLLEHGDQKLEQGILAFIASAGDAARRCFPPAGANVIQISSDTECSADSDKQED